jgi:hypothetical protein
MARSRVATPVTRVTPAGTRDRTGFLGGEGGGAGGAACAAIEEREKRDLPRRSPHFTQ